MCSTKRINQCDALILKIDIRSSYDVLLEKELDAEKFYGLQSIV